MSLAVSSILFVFGVVFGSFAGAQVWRLRLRQLREDKALGDEYDKKELRKLEKIHAPVHKDHSKCLHCGHELQLVDLLPIISWVSTKGKCRYCKKPIGHFELLIEIAVGAFFVLSYLAWPYMFDVVGIVLFALWLAGGVVLAILFSYDAKWLLLPNALNWLYAGLGLAYAGVLVYAKGVDITSIIGAIGILSGLYLLLYIISRGRWIGFGDVKLGLGLALFLSDWKLALIALFLANLVGTLYIVPQMIRGSIARGQHIPFGPFLMLGMVLAFLWGDSIITWYLGMLTIYTL